MSRRKTRATTLIARGRARVRPARRAAQHGVALRVGAVRRADAERTSIGSWAWTWAARFSASRAAVPLMRRHGGGRIINFADWVAASGRPRYKGYVAYYVAKAGVKALTEALALELAADQILVNAIAPGPILAPPGTSAEEHAAVEKATPLADGAARRNRQGRAGADRLRLHYGRDDPRGRRQTRELNDPRTIRIWPQNDRVAASAKIDAGNRGLRPRRLRPVAHRDQRCTQITGVMALAIRAPGGPAFAVLLCAPRHFRFGSPLDHPAASLSAGIHRRVPRAGTVAGTPTPSAARATGRTASGWSAAVRGPNSAKELKPADVAERPED